MLLTFLAPCVCFPPLTCAVVSRCGAWACSSVAVWQARQTGSGVLGAAPRVGACRALAACLSAPSHSAPARNAHYRAHSKQTDRVCVGRGGSCPGPLCVSEHSVVGRTVPVRGALQLPQHSGCAAENRLALLSVMSRLQCLPQTAVTAAQQSGAPGAQPQLRTTAALMPCMAWPYGRNSCSTP